MHDSAEASHISTTAYTHCSFSKTGLRLDFELPFSSIRKRKAANDASDIRSGLDCPHRLLPHPHPPRRDHHKSLAHLSGGIEKQETDKGQIKAPHNAGPLALISWLAQALCECDRPVCCTTSRRCAFVTQNNCFMHQRNTRTLSESISQSINRHPVPILYLKPTHPSHPKLQPTPPPRSRPYPRLPPL